MKSKIIVNVIAAFVLGIAGFVWLLNIDETMVPPEVLEQEYPYVLSKDSIDSEVIEIYCPPKTRGCGGIFSLVVFDSGLKRTIYAPRDISDSMVLSQILTIGSRIKKVSGNDTVNVFLKPDQAEPYKFVLRRNNR
ncbi:MAG: hypothetical protein ACK5RG_20855 [Cyclobacteriaceae bacterium]|jgi:hypothetical protein|nr:hypothetical protein [Flammeovirgaceae bacterium]